ncbi:ABC transporter permease [Algirhabdus cladophorae]|uniref:ABC transporter permease n=1 Tax=Algirhabdus cladophorae TaxID=3377108 RepID=UPI003B84A37B
MSADINTPSGLSEAAKIQRRSLPTLRVMFALMLREMATTYGKSPGGYIWAILEPVIGITLLTYIFSIGFKSPALGINFPIFYATGVVPFLMYMDISQKMAGSIQFSKPLLAYPAVTWGDAVLSRYVLNLLTQVLVGYIVISGILLLYETRTTLVVPQIALGCAMLAALAFGVGAMNCFLISMFPVWQRVWAIANRPLLFISCIFFTFESVPQPIRDYLWYNPMVHIIGMLRTAFYPNYDGQYVTPEYVFGVSLAMAVFGLVFLRRYNRDILEI